MSMDLSVVDRCDALVCQILLLQAVSADELSGFAETRELNAGGAQVRYQIVDAAHTASPSRSATIASISPRSSACRATIRAISALSSLMSTAARVSSAST